ncbi:protein-tyrosine phosphatase family protein [Haladaptatus cibarius]|uniref:protein-tyrosine phosphatase family protein n=1 Tax=Haladaptatus cibarius TaxID=453847 RepID=UPI000678DAEB|nr:dual specificity protein phosphatase [Haladaptatus cibarius]
MNADGLAESSKVNDSGIFVRPFGYVEPEPVIRRIGERNLYLGNKFAAHSKYHNQRFEYVVSATSGKYPLTTHHHPLIDGSGNEWSAFESAVDTVRTLYRKNGSLLVHCKAGISRSSTLIATALAIEENRALHDALATVQHARPHAIPNPPLHKLAVVYLAARSDYVVG